MGNLIEHWKLSKDDEEAWTTARNEWRFPYWDFAARQSDGKFGIPTACCVAKVEIYPPPGATSLKDKTYEDTIANPLEKFVNPEKDKNGNPLKFGYIEDLPGEKGKKSMWSIKRKTASGVPVGLSHAHVMHASFLLTSLVGRMHRHKSSRHSTAGGRRAGSAHRG